MSAPIRAMQLQKAAARLMPKQAHATNLLLRTNSSRHIVQKLGSFQLQQQLRLKSTFDPKSFEPGQQKSEDGEEKKIPKPSVGQIFSQAFKGAIQMLGGVFRSENLKKAWQTHPGEFSLAVIMLVFVGTRKRKNFADLCARFNMVGLPVLLVSLATPSTSTSTTFTPNSSLGIPTKSPFPYARPSTTAIMSRSRS